MFVGKDVLDFCLFDAIAHFNIGAQTVLNLYEALGITPGKYTVSGRQFLDKECLNNARYQVKEDNKSAERTKEEEEEE